VVDDNRDSHFEINHVELSDWQSAQSKSPDDVSQIIGRTWYVESSKDQPGRLNLDLYSNDFMESLCLLGTRETGLTTYQNASYYL
jgi:hypothetical protein